MPFIFKDLMITVLPEHFDKDIFVGPCGAGTEIPTRPPVQSQPSTEVERRLRLVAGLAWGTVALGVLLTGLDLLSPTGPWWARLEGPLVAAVGLVVAWQARGLRPELSRIPGSIFAQCDAGSESPPGGPEIIFAGQCDAGSESPPGGPEIIFAGQCDAGSESPPGPIGPSGPEIFAGPCDAGSESPPGPVGPFGPEIFAGPCDAGSSPPPGPPPGPDPSPPGPDSVAVGFRPDILELRAVLHLALSRLGGPLSAEEMRPRSFTELSALEQSLASALEEVRTLRARFDGHQ